MAQTNSILRQYIAELIREVAPGWDSPPLPYFKGYDPHVTEDEEEDEKRDSEYPLDPNPHLSKGGNVYIEHQMEKSKR